ncbi:MAG: ABC transporter substrate-binding protein [Fibrobacter sp.]|nr:ABC transporter substrate-binding protein [Fibrobacter sp.]
MLLLWSCRAEIPQNQNFSENVSTEYAVNYRLDSIPGYLILHVEQFFDEKSTTYGWILKDKRNPACPECKIPINFQKYPLIEYPVYSIAALSSTHLGILSELDLLSRVVAVSQAHLIHAPSIRQAIKSQSVAEVGFGPSLQIEQLLRLQPDVVLTFAVGDSRFDDYGILLDNDIPTLIVADWQEVHPLGRLEWIRLLGILTGTENRADSVFKLRTYKYLELCSLATQVKKHPKVITGTSEGENWRLTGGNTFFARLLQDAQADYLFAHSTSRNSFKINFEELFIKAHQVDYWINPSPWNTRSETLKNESRLSLFSFWEKNHILIPNKRRAKNGGNEFWELGMVRPDLLLSDLLHFLHPELGLSDSSVFYQFMED